MEVRKMTIIVVGSDRVALSTSTGVLKNVFPKDMVLSFSDPMMAIKYGAKNQIDVLFTEIKLNRMDGVSFANMLKSRFSKLEVIFMTGDEGYDRKGIVSEKVIFKPIDEKKVRDVST